MYHLNFKIFLINSNIILNKCEYIIFIKMNQQYKEL
jgi:hypothetical protein